MKISRTSMLTVLLISLICLCTMPAFGDYQGWDGAPCGAVGGEPPGWSQVNPGEGGTGSPGVGASGVLVTLGHFVTWMCSLI